MENGPEVIRTETIHASAVALDGRGVLILGPSGAGKSSLALQLIGQGAQLVGDDWIVLDRVGGDVVASAPAALDGLIEARGIGLLRAPARPAPLRLVVDLGRIEQARLPPIRHTTVMDISLPLALGPLTAHLSSAICLLLRGGRIDPEEGLSPETR
ncbi:HPr kinase/phosphorylase [Paracoccus sp. S1E-3]|uniref:HPr kinase/phosphorylase n=1 Tax=Paracoccus sp. S1E-3 TaxID=2756130 RepID=UPI0015EE8DD4|nr:HPr kinase/phosphatase C-terminal domain-containing protein [Paracoccus sp. S1E-3]MBA4490272.1 serine kinase [Paracoccus sp. S1E-3]